jgi:Putative peptidoglycan binding domain/Pilus formation protein N terminal region
MKTYITKVAYAFIGSVCAVACILSVSAPSAHAALVPFLSLSNNTGTTLVTVTVTGADPNVSTLFYYPGSSGYTSINIGSTNASGYLMTTIDSATYGIAQNAPVYVIVDGQQSQQQSWPAYTSSGGLSLTQSSVTLSAGQSTVVSASVSASLSLSNNSNPSVASASINGNQITILGIAYGTSNITVCAANIGCGTIQVSVSSTGSTGTSAISFSQSNISMSVGQLQQIAISGSGSYYISSNTNSAVVSTSLSGSTISLSGISAGTATLSVCSSNSGSTTCGTINVTVTGSSVNTTNTTTANLAFSPTSASIVAGQTESISILGGTNASTVYYVSNNTAPNVATVNTNGTILSVTGLAFGGDNVTVCQSGGLCGNLYVYVSTNTNTLNPTQTITTTNTTPVISSFTASTNSIGSVFINPGSVLTVSFTANQTINTPTVMIGGAATTVTGSGSGPYTATYSIPASPTLPLPVAITFTNPSGTGGQSYFWLGNTNTAPASPVVATVQSSSGASATHAFTEYLYEGSTGSEVTALQQQLKDDGVYSGPVTGTFGPLTKAAVEQYQALHGLSQVGVVGPATRALLNKGI